MDSILLGRMKNEIKTGYWDIKANQRHFMDNLAKELRISGQSQWYNITWTVIKQHGGDILFSKYNGSLATMLKSVYPEYTWKFRINEVERGHWSDISNQRAFMEAVAQRLKIVNHSGWYSVSCKVLREEGGGGLLAKHNGSISKLLATVYPEFPWDTSKFRVNANHVRTGYWNDIQNQREFMEHFARQNSILTPYGGSHTMIYTLREIGTWYLPTSFGMLEVEAWLGSTDHW